MNKYLADVLESVRTKHGNEPEFVQTVEEVLSSLEPVIEKHPEYEKVDLLGRMVEPERMFTFRVVWCDDAGQWHTTLHPNGYPGGIDPSKSAGDRVRFVSLPVPLCQRKHGACRL